MTTFFIFQLGVLFFSIASAIEEAAFTYPFRKLGAEAFPEQTKFTQLRTANRAGGIAVAMVLLAIGTSQYLLTGSFIHGLFALIAVTLVYWATFDPVFSLKIDREAFYLANTGGLNRWLHKVLGRNAGAKKAGICLVLIIAINLIFKRLQ